MPASPPLRSPPALGAAWLLAPDQLLPERVFLATLGWDGPGVAPELAGGTDGRTDPEGRLRHGGGANGVCSVRSCCEAARDLSGCGTGGDSPTGLQNNLCCPWG